MNTRFFLRATLAMSCMGETLTLGGEARAEPNAVPGSASLASSPSESAQPAIYVVEHEQEVVVENDWHAQTGLQLGVRFGYSFGAGAVFSGLPVVDNSDGALPLIVDAGARVLPSLYIGAYGQYAPVFTKDASTACPAGFSCNAADWRFGLEVDLHFLPSARWDPYVGLGAGYEILHSSIEGPAPVALPSGVMGVAQVNESENNRGWEFGSVTLGADIRLNRHVGLGPFFTFTLAEFNVRSGESTMSAGGVSTTTTVPAVNSTLHELFIFGARGTFNMM